jgi:hypothetical protein
MHCLYDGIDDLNDGMRAITERDAQMHDMDHLKSTIQRRKGFHI